MEFSYFVETIILSFLRKKAWVVAYVIKVIFLIRSTKTIKYCNYLFRYYQYKY